MTEASPDSDKIEEVEDPEEYVQSRRLRDIFNSRQELRRVRREADFGRNGRTWEATCAYRAAVATYVQEVEPLFYRFAGGEELWYDQEYGTIVADPEVYYREGNTYNDRGLYVDIHEKRDTKSYKIGRNTDEAPDPVEYNVTGLQSLFTIPNPMIETYRFETDGRHSHSETVEKEVVIQIPFGALDQMVSDTHQFLADIGFELDPTEGPDEMEI